MTHAACSSPSVCNFLRYTQRTFHLAPENSRTRDSISAVTNNSSVHTGQSSTSLPSISAGPQVLHLKRAENLTAHWRQPTLLRLHHHTATNIMQNTIVWCLLYLLAQGSMLEPISPQSDIRDALAEPAFGIEFELDQIVISMAFLNSTSIGLDVWTCGPEYQRLMQRLLDTCQVASETQRPPPDACWGHCSWRDLSTRWLDFRFLRPAHAYRDWILVSVFRQPRIPTKILSYDNLVDDLGVQVLGVKLSALRKQALPALADTHNLTAPTWPFARITVSKFFFTTIKPEPKRTGKLSREYLPNESGWSLPIVSKF